MFKIEAYAQTESCPTLTLSSNLFHEALKQNPASLARFHVQNPKGDDFDIVYYDNNDDIEPLDTYPAYQKPPFMASYRIYDENDTETLWMEFFDGVTDMVFEELNEYTIVLTKLVLLHTDITVFCTDPRIHYFVPQQDRLHVNDELP
ncbi:MAG: hypothetical protein K5649_06895, partial [Lachnospiraceae bacterium]|nr:hypothetical protein [Lachnospiraceae bacterium]